MSQNKSLPKTIAKPSAINPISVAWALLVVDHLSLRGAARELGVRQAAVSRRVCLLEDALGVSLFERRPTGVTVTNAGAHFFQQAREAFKQLDQASKTAGAAGQGATGHLSIGILSSMGAGFLRELIQVYSERHPGVSIQILEGAPPAEHISLVRRRRLDVAFVADTTETADCDVAALWKERLFAVLPHGHALGERKVIDWYDLRAERFIIRQAKCDRALCERVIKHLSDRAHSPVIQKVDVGRETVMHLVAMGRGVSITSEATLATSYPNVIFRPISGGDETVQFSAVWFAGNDNPALRRFLSLARARAKHKWRDPSASPPSNRPRSKTIGGITLSLAFLGALARRLGLST
jgi:DNA-binding transcriptional LysR family regulator